MNVEQVKTLFDYHHSLFAGLWVSVMQLSREQFVADNGYSLGSVRNHLVHCLNVDDRWLARLQAVEPPPVLHEPDFPNQALVKAEWDAVAQRVKAYIDSLSDASILESVSVSLAGRYSQPMPALRWQILLHVINHGTDHRAQILARLHELGAPTFEQDLMLHLWSGD